MAELNTPHDNFFKRLFGDLAVASDFMLNYLPPELLAQVELETLQIERESFVDPELRESFSDLLFRVRAKTGSAVFIYLLLEHKSAPDPWVAFQLLRYIVQFWEQRRRQGAAKLPLVIPIVFYHGQEGWHVPRQLSALLETADLQAVLKYAPDFEYCLRDVSLRGGAEIKGQPKLRAGLQLMRYIFSAELAQRLPEIFRNLRGLTTADALEFMRSLLAYVSNAGRKLKQGEVHKAMQEVFAKDEFNKDALFIQEWMADGAKENACEMTQRLIRNLLGEPDEAIKKRIRALPKRRIDELFDAVPGFTSLAEVSAWLNARAAQQHSQAKSGKARKK